MRAAYICGACLGKGIGAADSADLAADIQALLSAVSSASRANEDILEANPPLTTHSASFDVFLCHNSDDKPSVRELNELMKSKGIATWLDEEQLPPGQPWQPELERVIGDVAGACVFVGSSGFGPWQKNEIRAFLDEFDSDNRPVIPVLLPQAGEPPTLPIFLRQRTWIDLRDAGRPNLDRLLEHLKSLGS